MKTKMTGFLSPSWAVIVVIRSNCGDENLTHYVQYYENGKSERGVRYDLSVN